MGSRLRSHATGIVLIRVEVPAGGHGDGPSSFLKCYEYML